MEKLDQEFREAFIEFKQLRLRAEKAHRKMLEVDLRRRNYYTDFKFDSDQRDYE